MNQENDTSAAEVLEPSVIGQLERASIDMQIATARRYPRALSSVKSNMLSFATLDEDTAAGCFYTLPARRGGDNKPIKGPSVRLAEIALTCYQHIRAGSRIIEDDGKFITAQGVVHDLQNNVIISIEVKRRVTNKQGVRFGDDMIAVTGNAACSIALRNAAFRVVPLALVKPVYEAAMALAVGDAKSLVERRAICLARLAKISVTAEMACAALEINSPEDITLDHLEILFGYFTAIKDGDATVDDIFGKKEPEVKPDLSGGSALDRFKKQPATAKPADKFADLPETKTEASAAAPASEDPPPFSDEGPTDGDAPPQRTPGEVLDSIRSMFEFTGFKSGLEFEKALKTAGILSTTQMFNGKLPMEKLLEIESVAGEIPLPA